MHPKSLILKILISGSLLIVPFYSVAAGGDYSCEAYADRLVERLQDELFPAMSSAQKQHARRLSVSSCQEYFATGAGEPRHAAETGEESAKTQEVQAEQEAKPAPERENKTRSGDWFTEYLLSGESPNKPGNKRLRNLK